MSDFTKATYLRSLNTLRNGMGLPPNTLDFLDKPDPVCKWIDEHPKYKPNSKKVFYIAIVATLKETGLYPEALKTYRERMDKANKAQDAVAVEQALTADEAEKYVEWPELLNTVTEKIFPAATDLASYQDYLIASLYTLLPPIRLDYAEMKVLPAEPNTLEGNYLIVGGAKKKPYFLLTQYKTARKYGEQRIAIPDELARTIREWLTLAGEPEYFLLSQNGNPMPAWELGQTITRVFKKHLGKSVSVNILRHSYISWMRQGEISLKASTELATSMLHSPGMSQIYRRID
jgi:integrase